MRVFRALSLSYSLKDSGTLNAIIRLIHLHLSAWLSARPNANRPRRPRCTYGPGLCSRKRQSVAARARSRAKRNRRMNERFRFHRNHGSLSRRYRRIINSGPQRNIFFSPRKSAISRARARTHARSRPGDARANCWTTESPAIAALSVAMCSLRSQRDQRQSLVEVT